MTFGSFDLNPDVNLIAKSANPGVRLEDGRTALMWAAWRNDFAAAHLLLERHVEVDITDAFGWTALTCAGWNGGSETARLLLEHGAFADHLDHDGLTPLMRAAANNRADTVETLLNFGAKAHLRSGAGKTAYDYAKANHCAETLALLGKAARGALPPPKPAVEPPPVIRWPKGFNL